MVEIRSFKIRGSKTRERVMNYLDRESLFRSEPSGNLNFMYFFEKGQGYAFLECKRDEAEVVTLNVNEDVIKSLEGMVS